MSCVRVGMCLMLLLCSCFAVSADSFAVKSKRLTVLGVLLEDAASGGAGHIDWSIQLNPVIMLGGTQISSLEIRSSDTQKLLPLEDKFVLATGKLTMVAGASALQRPVFELSSIKEHKSKGHRP
jgi:hypothetical protein